MKGINKSIILLLSFIILSCSKMAENNIIQVINGSGNNYKAVIFSRNVGATTGKNIQISVIEQDKDLPNKPGNVFIADYVDEVKVYWINEKELHIAVPKKEVRIYKKKEAIDSIKITY